MLFYNLSNNTFVIMTMQKLNNYPQIAIIILLKKSKTPSTYSGLYYMLRTFMLLLVNGCFTSKL